MLSSVLFSQGVVGRHSIYNTGDGLLRHDIDVIAAGVRPLLAVRWYWTGVDTRTQAATQSEGIFQRSSQTQGENTSGRDL